MALAIKDRVKELTTTTGTGALTLVSAPSGFRRFNSVLSDNDVTYYCIESGNQWEVGVGTYNANTLARTTVLVSSNSNSLINITAARSFVFITYPADKAVYKNESGQVSVGASGIKFSDNSIQTTATTPDLSTYAPLSNPSFTGVPTAPTASSGTNTTQIATTQFVTTTVGAIDLTPYLPSSVAASTYVALGGSYSNPSWIASLAWGKLSSIPAVVTALSGVNTGDQTTIVGITGTKTQFDSSCSDGDFMYMGDAPTSHTHGNITNDGAIGLTASLPIITGASGVLQTGSFGTASGTFCQGNDSRLSDARTPTTHSHTPSDITGFGEAVDNEVATLLVAGTNITITYNDAANTLTIASTAGGLSGTGSVDNAVLRADGTGGATLQSSAWIINDNLTASPNNTVNHACLEATGGTTNVSVSIKPKGTGAFCLSVPDGTATGGNARGANAVDLQTSRALAANVASGQYSLVAGYNSSATTRCGVSLGYECNVTGADGTSLGMRNQVTTNGFAAGRDNQVTVIYGSVPGGLAAIADRHAMQAHAAGQFAAAGDAQSVRFVCRRKTTNNTPTTLMLDGTSIRLTITSGKILFADISISGIKSDGSAAACYKRKVAIKNVGGTTALVGSVETIGTDIEDNAATDVSITADNTNDALQIDVTGISGETWRWVAVVEGLEIAYGT